LHMSIADDARSPLRNPHGFRQRSVVLEERQTGFCDESTGEILSKV
jgi:hypothetical protein